MKFAFDDGVDGVSSVRYVGVAVRNVIGIEVTTDKATRVTASVLGRLENA